MQKFQCEEFEIMDAHTHIFPPKIAEKATVNIGHFYDIPMAEEGNAERLLQCGAKIGTKRYLVCSTATTSHQVESINDFIAEECGKHPEFYGFGTLHPDYADLEGETNRIIRLGLHGIKLHPDFQCFDIDSPGAYKIYEQIAGRLPVLIHMGDDRYAYSKPERLARVMQDFPTLRVMASHLGGYRCWEEARECLRGNANIRFDTSSSLPMLDPAYARKLIEHYGVENCMFGTDFPMWEPTEEFARFMNLGFGFADNQRMLSGTFKEWFGL